jgi:hypothetical protein
MTLPNRLYYEPDKKIEAIKYDDVYFFEHESYSFLPNLEIQTTPRTTTRNTNKPIINLVVNEFYILIIP